MKNELKQVYNSLNDAKCEIASLKSKLSGEEIRIAETIASEKAKFEEFMLIEKSKLKHAIEEHEIDRKKLKNLSDELTAVKVDNAELKRELSLLKAQGVKEESDQQMTSILETKRSRLELKCEQLIEEKNFFQQRGELLETIVETFNFKDINVSL